MASHGTDEHGFYERTDETAPMEGYPDRPVTIPEHAWREYWNRRREGLRLAEQSAAKKAHRQGLDAARAAKKALWDTYDAPVVQILRSWSAGVYITWGAPANWRPSAYYVFVREHSANNLLDISTYRSISTGQLLPIDAEGYPRCPEEGFAISRSFLSWGAHENEWDIIVVADDDDACRMHGHVYSYPVTWGVNYPPVDHRTEIPPSVVVHAAPAEQVEEVDIEQRAQEAGEAVAREIVREIQRENQPQLASPIIAEEGLHLPKDSVLEAQGGPVATPPKQELEPKRKMDASRTRYILQRGHPKGGWDSLRQKHEFYVSQGGALGYGDWSAEDYPLFPDEDQSDEHAHEDYLANGGRWDIGAWTDFGKPTHPLPDEQEYGTR